MKYGKLVFEKEEFQVLFRLLELPFSYDDYAHLNTIELLRTNMESALLLDRTELPDDIVQMYSLVTLRSVSGYKEVVQMVTPKEADPKSDQFSVLSSLGASLIGRSEGDEILLGSPGSMRRIAVGKVVPYWEKADTRVWGEAYRKLLPCKVNYS